MIIMTILCVIMVVLGIYHLFMLPSGGAKKQGEQRTAGQVMKELSNVLIDFFKKSHIVYYIFSSFSIGLQKDLS